MVKKIKDYDRNLNFQAFARSLSDVGQATYWIFYDNMGHKHIEGHMEGGNFWAHQIKKMKRPELNKWYNTVGDAFKKLQELVEEKYSTGLPWNSKADPAAFDKFFDRVKDIAYGKTETNEA